AWSGLGIRRIQRFGSLASRSLNLQSSVCVAGSPPAPFSTALEMTNVSKPFVFKVSLAFLCLCIFVLAQNIFIELHVGSKKILKPCFDALSILQHFFGDVISIDVDANRPDDSEFLSFDGDCGAFEFSRTDVQLVVQLVLVQKLATFQVNQQ